MAAVTLLAAPAALPAQEAMLDGVRYVVPEGFGPEPSRSDATLAVLSQPSTGARLFVATLAPGAIRAEAAERILARMAGATVPGQTPLRWHWAGSLPVSRFEVYHERHQGSTSNAGLEVEIRHLRFKGRDILAGYSFPLSETDTAAVFHQSRAIGRDPAQEGAARLIGSLLDQGPLTALMPVARRPAVPRPARPDPEASQVRAVYEAYRDALVSNDGEAAARLVAEPTLEYFAEILRLARSASDEDLKAQPLMNQLLALRVRGHVTPERLRAMSARELFALTVTDSATGVLTWKKDAARRGVGQIAVIGDLAVVMTTLPGKPSPPMSFVRQEGGWRLDLLYLLPGNAASLEAAAKRRGLPEDAVLPMGQIASPPAKAPEQARADYMASIDRELEYLERFDGAEFRAAMDSTALRREILLFAAWAVMIHEGGTHALSDAEKSRVEQARRMISEVQAREFPEIRAVYARDIDEILRRNGPRVSVAGPLGDTLRLTDRIYRRKAFAVQLQEVIEPRVKNLRFRRVEYRWGRGADEYTAFDLDAPADDVILHYTETGPVPLP